MAVVDDTELVGRLMKNKRIEFKLRKMGYICIYIEINQFNFWKGWDGIQHELKKKVCEG